MTNRHETIVPQCHWAIGPGPLIGKTTVAHRCHGKTFFLTAKLSFSRQNFLSHGKTFFLTAKLSLSRQNFLSQGKTFFLTAKLSFSRQNFAELFPWAAATTFQLASEARRQTGRWKEVVTAKEMMSCK